MATDEEVEAQRQAVIELRQKVEDAKTGGAEKQRELDNDIAMGQLAAEEARLQAELATAQEANKITRLRAGAAAPLGSVTEQMKAAVAHQEAVAKEITANRKNGGSTTSNADQVATQGGDAEKEGSK